MELVIFKPNPVNIYLIIRKLYIRIHSQTKLGNCIKESIHKQILFMEFPSSFDQYDVKIKILKS